MAHQPTRRVIIIGAGDSGLLAVRKLLDEGDEDVRVTLIEQSPKVVRAIKRATSDARTAGLAALPASLKTYLIGDTGRPGRLHLIEGEARAIALTQKGVVIELADGTSSGAHVAVLATGRDPAMIEDAVYTVPCDVETRVPMKASVLAIGTNVVIANCIARILARGHKGRIYAVSADGLLPFVDEAGTEWQLDRADIPFGTGLPYLLDWVRKSVRWAETQGVSWRQFVDALQPYASELWQHFSEYDRRRFVHRLGGLWDAHRDRMSPSAASTLGSAVAIGQLTVIAGKIRSVAATASGAVVEIEQRNRPEVESISVEKIVQRRGAHRELLGSRNPIVKSLLDQGFARPDPAALGLEVTDDAALVDQRSIASSRLFAVGPAARAAIWDIVGPRSLEEQCDGLLRQVLGPEPSLPRSARR